MENKYIVDYEDLKAIADAIRAKSGIDDTLEFPDGFINAIQNISTT